MHWRVASAALSATVLTHTGVADSLLTDSANVLIWPNLDAANILFNVLKTTSGQGMTTGPMLLNAAAPVHILTPSTVRRILNVTALAAAVKAN